MASTCTQAGLVAARGAVGSRHSARAYRGAWASAQPARSAAHASTWLPAPQQPAALLAATPLVAATPAGRRPGMQRMVACAAVAEEAAPAPTGMFGMSPKQIVLIGLFALWYASNIFFNIWNKQVLKMYPFPVTNTLVELTIGSCLALAMWTLRLHKAPQLNWDMVKSLFPLACIHTLGNVLTNVSLTQVAVSFTHTVKAAEPFFSCLLSWLFLGTVPSLAVVATLVPIVGGVALASFAEPSFSWFGFLSALGSNITFQSRNVLSKKMMLKNIKQGTMDNINIFSVITIMAALICLPVALLSEGVKFTPSALSAHLGSTAKTEAAIRLVLLSGLGFHTYQQVSYLILQRVEPVTHAVGNCVKRVVVIVSSIIFFQNPVSPINAAGTALALGGVFLYSKAKPPKKGAE